MEKNDYKRFILIALIACWLVIFTSPYWYGWLIGGIVASSSLFGLWILTSLLLPWLSMLLSLKFGMDRKVTVILLILAIFVTLWFSIGMRGQGV